MNRIIQERNQRIGEAVFLILIGIMMCVFTSFTETVFVMVSGILCLVFGCLYLAAYFASILFHDPYLLMRGLFLILAGTLVLSYPAAFIYVVVFASSIYLIYNGIQEMSYAIDLATLKVKNWWVDLIDSIISLGCGIAVLVVQFTNGGGMAVVIEIAGASLIVMGILELILIFALHRDFKKANKVVSNQ